MNSAPPPVPLDPELAAELAGWLARVRRPLSPDRAACRVAEIGAELAAGKPHRELFLYAAAVALAGYLACVETAERAALDRRPPGVHRS